MESPNYLHLLTYFGQNLILLFSLIFIISMLDPYIKRFSNIKQQCILGSLFGITTIIAINIPLFTSKGVIIDLRFPLIAICGVFYGPIAILVNSIITISYSILLGGSGLFIGIGSIITTGLLAYWISWDKIKKQNNLLYNFITLGLLIAVVNILWLQTLPDNIRKNVFTNYTIANHLFYPIIIWLYGKAYSLYLARQQIEEMLAEREKSLQQTMQELLNTNQEMKRMQDILQHLVAGTSTQSGEQFFETIVLQLGQVLNADYAFIGEINQEHPDTIKTLALYGKGQLMPNVEYSLIGTPCHETLKKSICIYKSNVRHHFPHAFMLDKFGIEAYIGVPLFDPQHQLIGEITVLSCTPLTNTFFHESILQIFATRVAQEISRLRRELEYIAAKDSAIKANNSKNKILANIVHEIRTPLNGIVGVTEILEETPLTDEQKEFLGILRFSSDRMLSVINDLSDISKIEAGKIELEEDFFELHSLIDKLIKSFEVSISKKGIRFAANISSDVPNFLIGDKGRLNQILVNLMNNAVKFTNEGEISVEIKKINQLENHVQLYFCVKDTGIGIPTSKLHKIFERFYQVDSSNTKKHSGTGLGLSICKEFVELMGGTIGVESIEGVGSKFSFTVNLKDTNPVHKASSTSFNIAEHNHLQGSHHLSA